MDSKKTIVIFTVASIFGACLTLPVAAQQHEPVDVVELAEKEAERLGRVLQLEDWQVFYVDSTLVHDYQAMEQEIKDLTQSKVTNTSIYQSVQDKWIDTIEESYKKFFTEEQWEAYLKQGAARAQKQREKRRMAAEGVKSEKTPKSGSKSGGKRNG